MIELSRTFVTSAKDLSLEYNDASQSLVLEAMIRIMKQTIKYVHAIYVKDLFKNLVRKNIGTIEVKRLAKKLCSKLPRRREKTLISIVMKWKLQDAENSLRKAKYENTRVWRTDKIVIDKWNLLEVFNNIW